jgi:D-sedoheptulose 7-phosphate isomerase
MAGMDRERVAAVLEEAVAAKRAFLACRDDLVELCRLAEEALRGGGKLLLCGNGGSACDAAHLACELVGWFHHRDRPPLPALALGFETPMATAIANDKGYDQVFRRQLEALGRPGDLLIGISTSGRSPSVVGALERAREMGLATAAVTGREGRACAAAADFTLAVPAGETPRIQECHLLVFHVLAEWLEARLAVTDA